MKKSVKSINPCKSVIQTSYDIVKAQGRVTIAIGIKLETKEEDDLPVEQTGIQFIPQIPIS